MQHLPSDTLCTSSCTVQGHTKNRSRCWTSRSGDRTPYKNTAMLPLPNDTRCFFSTSSRTHLFACQPLLLQKPMIKPSQCRSDPDNIARFFLWPPSLCIGCWNYQILKAGSNLLIVVQNTVNLYAHTLRLQNATKSLSHLKYCILRSRSCI